MKLYEKVGKKIYEITSELGIVYFYKEIVKFVRQNPVGRALHRIFRIAIIHLLIVVLTNFDPSNLSGFDQALYAGALAGLDKFKNEALKWLRSLSNNNSSEWE